MNKRLLSMFLALCMVLTMLPVSAMAQEAHRIIGGGGEIIAFASLAQTEKTVTVGTSLEDLELPETLTATVRTNFGFGVQADTNQQTVTDSVYNAEDEVILVDIPVTWTSQPEYDMDTDGVYVFTPVIEGYTVSADLPEITVTVETAMLQGMIAPLSAIGYDIWVGDTRVTSANAGDVLGDGRVSYTPAAEGTIQTLTFNDANITTAFMGSDSKYGIYAGDSLNLVLEGNSTVGGSSSLDTNLYTSIGVNVFGDLNISGTGSITVTGGNAKFFSRGIVVSNFTVSGGNVTAIGGNTEIDSYGIFVTNFTVSGGNVTATGNNNGINVMSNFILSGGNVTATGGIRAINKAPDLRGVQGTASTSYDGSSPVAYNAANITSYKYLKFEPSSGVTEQFTLLPGGTYYFDLSGEKNNIGTVNTALPDTTLHYVPFTYAGTVNAYSLTSQRVTNEAYATANKSDRSLFVGDYNIGTTISWDSLNTANLIFGKTFDTNYKLRSLSAGSSKTGSASNGSDHMGQPNTNEWDQILTKSGSANNITGWIKNWSGRMSCGQDTAASAPSLRAIRGDTSARYWTYVTSSAAYSGCGFRPALEVLNPDTLTSDGLKAVTLKLNGGKLKESAADIQIICAGSSFTAPSSEGLTAPAAKVFSGWKDTSGTTYAAGTTVPNTVTGLTAQWAVPPGALTGTASISNPSPRIGDALNGSLESNNNTGTLTYVWKVDGTQVGTGTSYTVAVADLGKTITLEIRSSVETGTITSAATAAVAKKIAPPAPTAPTLATKTYNTVTLTANANYEFSKDSTTWQSINVFTGLNASTAYTFYQRVAETPDRESSAASTGLSVTTDAPPPSALTGTATISNTSPRIGDALNGALVSGNNSGTLSYVWKADGTQVGTEESYIVTVADLGKTITLEIRSSVETGTITSAATAVVLKKAALSAPAAPTLASKTYNTVTLTANANYEFSKGGSTWQTNNVFSDLNASTAYTFYQRVAETPDRESSAASTGLSVTTDAPPPSALTGTAMISNTSPRIGDALNGSLVSGNNSGTLSYVWKADGTQVGTEESYIVTVADLGKTITLEIRSSVETGTITSATTAAVAKKIAPPAPTAPTLATKTYNSVTLTANGDYQFSKDGTIWQTNNVFSGLNASTAYTFYQRVAETPDRESSASSTGLSVTTNSNAGGGSAPSGGGGGNSSDNNSSVIVILPPPDMPNSPTQGEVKVLGTVDDKGNFTVNITGKTVTDAFEKALADAKKNGYEQNGITVILRIDTGSKTRSNVAVNLPKTVQDTILAKKIVNIIVVIDNPDISIGMDLATVEKINQQAKSDVNITATPTDSHKLTEEAKKAIGSRPVFDLKVNYGSGQQVQSFGSGSVSVAIPYTLSANEKAENVQAVYVDSNGKVHWLANSVYDSVEKVLRFSTNHFSTYGVGYKQTIVESTDEFTTAFTDIESHWAKENIEFVINCGLFSGTSATTFSPNTAMTRGMFVTVLGKLANTDVSGYKQSSFNDVTSNAYYMGYIEWASQNSISKGIGNGAFAPDQSITREQMAVIMQNYAKIMDFTMPKVHGENTFADNAKISAYAKDAVKQMQMAGVIGGKNDNLFDPQGIATRAEVSTVLRRLMELWISSDTM